MISCFRGFRMVTIEEISVFCKKKGFVYPTAEIYGGLSGFFDFSYLGVELKNNIKQHFWKTFVKSRQDVVGIDGSIITNPKVWVASGHAENFGDILIECKKCSEKLRADVLIENVLKIKTEGMNLEELGNIIKNKNLFCPNCKGEFRSPVKFNLMFETNVGPTKGNVAFLRPETAQLIFTDFKLVSENARLKLPFGIAQIGKAYRNEISPRDFLFRMREFEQMEIEFFTHPNKADDCPLISEVINLKVNFYSAENQVKNTPHLVTTIKNMLEQHLLTQWHAYWLGCVYQWFLTLGINPDKIRIREHLKEELAHYAGACFDIEYEFSFGWKEIHGNADRRQFDMSSHIQASKKDLTYFDEETKSKVIPMVASEPSQGVERAFLAFLCDAYYDDKDRGNIVLKLDPELAPIKVGIFPLINKLDEKAKEVYNSLRHKFTCLFDRSGSIGRRYARADEIGVLYSVTIDFETLDNNTVTLRDRDTTKQVRISIDDLSKTIILLLNKEIKLENAGKLI